MKTGVKYKVIYHHREKYGISGMCEAHICDTIRKAFPHTKRVHASRASSEAAFLTEDTLDTEKLAKAITDTGYTFVSAESEPYKKRGLFG